MVIKSSAATLIDLAGGTIDMWPLCLFHTGSLTLNDAIHLYAITRIHPGEDSSILVPGSWR